MTAERRRLVVVSNRGPLTYERDDRGERTARRGAGGLVTALAPLVSLHDVTWIASASSDEDRRVAAAGPQEESWDGHPYRLVLLAHEPERYARFYSELANPVLWFLQHGLWSLIEEPEADRTEAWEAYEDVNEGFAAAVLAELERAPGAAVLFQDYHLYRAPRRVRAERPDVALGHFVHIPWVEPSAWEVLPREIVVAIHEGLVACDHVGFHTERWRRAFLDSAATYLPDGVPDGVRVDGTPISVDVAEWDALAASPGVRERQAELERERPELLVLRVDRTDPSKNAVRGFEAFGVLLERRPDLHGRVGLLALLDPSRLAIPEYRTYSDAITAAAAAVNDRFARDGWTPVRLDVRDDFAASVAGYLIYDVLLVNPVLDGLNLVAKEAPLVNERDGAVVLSRGAGAYEELAPWVEPVDPLDVHDQAAALERALELPLAERRRRQDGIRAHVHAHDLGAWSRAQLDGLDRAVRERATSMRA